MVPQVLPPVRREPDIPALHRRLVQLAAFEVVTRGSACIGLELQFEKLGGLFHHRDKLGAAILLFLRLGIAGGHGHPGLARHDFDGLHEGHVFGFLDEPQRVAFGVAAEAIVVALFVVHVEGRGFFLMERARRPHVAFAGLRLALVPHDFAPDHLRNRGTALQLI